MRYVDGTGLDAWDLALSIVLRLGHEHARRAKGEWASPFRAVGSKWSVLTEAGYVDVDREIVQILVRRVLDRHYRLTRGGPTYLHVTRRKVATVIAEIARLPCVATEAEPC